MAFSIDRSTYNKAKRYAQRHGYQLRGTQPTSIVVHSTEGSRGQSLVRAATYLYTSADVSAHFLIGKSGEIFQFLDPKKHQAWHAGGQQLDGSWTALPAYSNTRSIGIECLHARGEPWPDAQKAALGWLLNDLVAAYAIPLAMVETHGQIAIPGPYKRKVDPTDWPHDAFLAWRSRSIAAPAPPPIHLHVKGVPIYQRRDRTGPLVGHLTPAETVAIDAVYDDGGAHLADGRGFVDSNALEPV